MKVTENKSLIQLAALIAERLDDMDLISSCVNIRFGGDYDQETEAKDVMYYTYVEIAYIVLRSLKPMLTMVEVQQWKENAMNTINNIGIRMGFVYSDNDADSFEEEALVIYNHLTKKRSKPIASEEYLKEFEELVKKLTKQGVYPMDDDTYMELLQDRNLDF